MIRDWLPILIASTLTLLGCSPLSPEIQVIHDAGDAMGGVDHVLETENIVLQGSGRQYRLGQNQDPDDELVLAHREALHGRSRLSELLSICSLSDRDGDCVVSRPRHGQTG